MVRMFDDCVSMLRRKLERILGEKLVKGKLETRLGARVRLRLRTKLKKDGMVDSVHRPLRLGLGNEAVVSGAVARSLNRNFASAVFVLSRRFYSLVLSCCLGVMLLVCSGCNPYVPHMGSNLPYYGDNDYQKGFEDGCAAFTIFVSKGFTRFIPIGKYVNGWKLTGKHPDITNAKLYVEGFKEGQSYCTFNLDANIL